MFGERYANCPVCGSVAISTALQRRYFDIAFNFDACADCGLTFQNPPLSASALRDLYRRSDYFNAAYSQYATRDRARTLHAHKRLDRIMALTGLRGGRHLDIGSATGFCGVASRAKRFQVTCIEPDQDMVDYGRKNYGLKFQAAIFEEAELDPPYDLVTMWGTDSHLLHPLKSYQRIGEALRPGGVFAMNYQRFDHWLRRIFPEMKVSWNTLHQWTDRSFDTMLSRVGLRLVDRSTEWQSTNAGHIARAVKIAAPAFLDGVRFTVPAVSFPMIVAVKR